MKIIFTCSFINKLALNSLQSVLRPKGFGVAAESPDLFSWEASPPWETKQLHNCKVYEIKITTSLSINNPHKHNPSF